MPRFALLTCLLPFFICLPGLGQNKALRPLKEVLNTLENSRQLKFSYVENVIRDEKVALNQNNVPVDTLLMLLEKQTSLRFELAGDNYVVIRSFKNSDKINICGFLVDAAGLPVEAAVVFKDYGTHDTVTDSTGFFRLTASHGSLLRFSHLSYREKRVTASELYRVACPKIRLVEATDLLSEVVIQDFLSVGISKFNQSLHIYPDELKVLPGLIEPDVLQSLQQAPGVSNPFETASGIFVRGGSPDQNLVLWNGIKTYNQSHFFGMISAFNPYITNEVQFIKNGTSAKYGERVSGVIDIKSSNEVVEKFSGGAGTNLMAADAYIDVPIIPEKASFQLSARRSFTDRWQTPTYDKYADRVFQNTKITESAAAGEMAENTFFFNDYSAKVVGKWGENDLMTLNALYSRNDLDFLSSGANEAFRDILFTENEGYSVDWSHTGKLSWQANAYYSKYLLDYAFERTSADSFTEASKKNVIEDYGIRLSLEAPLSNNQTLTSGYQLFRNDVGYSFENETPTYRLLLDADNRSLLTHAAFSEYHWQTNRIQVTAGIRLNHYVELNETYLEPRLWLQQAIVEGLKLTASAEYRSQTLSQIKESVVSDLSLENQVWTLSSNERFPIITSNQFTFGGIWEKGNWLIDAEAYLKNIDGVTTLTFGFLNPLDNGYREGESDIRGVDIFIKRHWQRYKTWLGYSYVSTENRFIGLNNGEPFPGNWNIEHTLRWSHFYTLGNLHLSLGWLWHTGKMYTEVDQVNNNPTGPIAIAFNGINESQLPVYHRLDFSALYEFKTKPKGKPKYRIGISLFNLYDRHNLINREFRTTPSLNNDLIDTRVYGLGITPNLVFRVFW